MSFSDEDASAWNVLAAEEHLGGRSSSLGRRGHEGPCRMMLCFPYVPPHPPPLGAMPSIQGERQHQHELASLFSLFTHPSLQDPPLCTLTALCAHH